MINGKKIFAIDFDGTLFTNDFEYPEVGKPRWDVIQAVKNVYKNGDYVILWTCRQTEGLDNAIEASKKVGLKFHAINENIPEAFEWVLSPIDPSPKVLADYYVDDKAHGSIDHFLKIAYQKDKTELEIINNETLEKKIKERKWRRSGGIPYFVKDQEVFMYFMKPSNPLYGGNDFQIAKGTFDKGETPLTTAIRECGEELGLLTSNVVDKNHMIVRSFIPVDQNEPPKYDFYVFLFQIRDINQFNDPHFETGEVRWMTANEFSVLGRKDQVKIVLKANQEIKRKFGLR